MRRAASLSLMFALACSRRSPDAAPSSDAAPTPSASASAPAMAAPLDDASRKALTAWSAALDAHDLAALERIYAPTVGFYGQRLPRATVLDIKRRALGPKSTFRQSLVGEPTITRRADGADTLLFVKRSGTDGKMRETKALLTVRDGLVTEELDAQTKVREPSGVAMAPADEPSACEAAAAKAVDALPAVQRVIKDDQKAVAASPGTTMGGLGPIREPGGGFSASLGIHHAERYEGQVWYTVDAVGRLEVTVEGATVAVPAAALAAIAQACKLP